MTSETESGQWPKPKMNGVVQCVKKKNRRGYVHMNVLKLVTVTDAKDRETVDL